MCNTLLDEQQEKKKDSLLTEQNETMIVQDTHFLTVDPVPMPQPEPVSLGVQQRQLAQEQMNVMQGGLPLGNVVQLPGEADVQVQIKNMQDSKRTDKSRKNHREKSEQRLAAANQVNARYNEAMELLKSNAEMTLERRKIIEKNCLQSGLEGIRLLAESEQEKIKSTGNKDMDELHELAYADLQRDIRLQQFYQQMTALKTGQDKEGAEKIDWDEQQFAHYRHKRDEMKESVEKQRGFVEHSGILSKLEQKMADVKAEIEAKEQGGAPLEEGAHSIQKLSLQDFASMIGTHSRGQVAFSGNGLTAIRNHKFSVASNKQSEADLQIRKQLLAVVMNELGGEDHAVENETEEFFALTRNQLGLNDATLTQAPPLSRLMIQDIISKTNQRASIVANNLKVQKPRTRLDRRISENINTILGGREETEKKENVTSLLNGLKEYISDTPDLNKHQMDNLVKGNMPRLQNEIYASVEKISKRILEQGAGKELSTTALSVDSFLSDTHAMKLLAAFHIQKMTAGTHAAARLADLKLQEYMEQVTLAHLAPTDALKGNEQLAKLEAPEAWDAESLRGKLGAAASPQEETSFTEFVELCDSIHIISSLRTEAFAHRLTTDQVSQMVTKVAFVVGAFIRTGAVAEFDKLGAKLANTRAWEGYQQAKHLVETRALNIMHVAEFAAETKAIIKPENDGVQLPTGEKENNPMTLLPENAKNIALMLTGKSHASGLIQKKSGDPFAQNMLRLGEFLGTFKSGDALAQTINIDGQDIVFVQDSHQILKMVVNEVSVPLAHSVAKIVEHLNSEILLNNKAFSQEVVKQNLEEMENAPENSPEQAQAREVSLNILASRTGKPTTFFYNVSSKSLLGYVRKLIVTGGSKRERKEAERRQPAIVQEIITEVNTIEEAVYINGKEAAELIKQLEKENWRQKASTEKAKITMEKAQPKVGNQQAEWTGDEKKIVDLVSNLIFSGDTWVADELREKPGARVQKVLLDNVPTLRLLVRQPALIASILDRMALGGEEEAAGIKAQIMEQMDSMLSDPRLKMLRKGEEKKPEATSGIFSSIAAAGRAMKETLLDKAAEVAIEKFLRTEAEPELFENIDKHIDAMITEKSVQIQEMITQSLQSAYDADEVGQEQPVAGQAKTAAGLTSMIEKSMKGKTGQGLFLKNVFQSYFSNVSAIDKRSMFASAVNYSVPKQKLPDTATQEDKEQAEKSAEASFIGGFLKGTGPLLQKTLQGIPSGAMPSVIDNALKDMKSSLSPIPQTYVDAQLNGMVNRSKGEITQIHIQKSLGAASVGQAFLCTMFGPNLGDKGTEVVVKLLRPDVRNRIEREKKVMLEAAANTGEGMKATYEGQLRRIEEEMDLTIEAENAQRGEVYDNAKKTVKAMKVNELVQPTMNALVLEKAPGTTVDRYMNDVRDKQMQAVSKYYQPKEDDPKSFAKGEDGKRNALFRWEHSIDEVKESKAVLIAELAKLQQRQTYLIEMAKAWVTEGIYGKGFYHGDLHAGNMMIDDKGLTLIDFGNATQLDEEAKKHVLRMMSAAAAGENFTEMFRNAFHKLLAGASEEKYQSNRDQLGEVFRDILQHGEQKDAGLRICAALMKAQEMGVEVPAAIYNFSQSQMRLQNTIAEMNGVITSIQADIANLQEHEEAEACNVTYDSQHAGQQVSQQLKLGSADINTREEPFSMKEGWEVDKEEFINQLKSKDQAPLQSTLSTVSYEQMGNNVLYGYLIGVVDGIKADKDKAMKEGGESKESYADGLKLLLDDFKKNQFSHGKMDGILLQTVSSVNGDPKEFDARYDALMGRVLQAATKHENNPDKIKVEISIAWGEFVQQTSAIEKDLQDQLAKYREEQNKKDANPEVLQEMQEGLYSRYAKTSDTIKLNRGEFVAVRSELYNKETRVQIEVELKQWFNADRTVGEGSSAVRKTYYQLVEALDKNQPDIIAKEKAFFAALQSVIDRIHQSKRMNVVRSVAGVNKKAPPDFVAVMGDVISANATASLRRLGLSEGIRLKSALN